MCALCEFVRTNAVALQLPDKSLHEPTRLHPRGSAARVVRGPVADEPMSLARHLKLVICFRSLGVLLALLVLASGCSGRLPVAGSLFVAPTPPPRNMTLFEASFVGLEATLRYRHGWGACYGDREIEITAQKSRRPREPLRIQVSRVACDGDGTSPNGAPRPVGEFVEVFGSWSDGTFGYQVWSGGPDARARVTPFIRSLELVGHDRWLSTARQAAHRTLPGHA